MISDENKHQGYAWKDLDSMLEMASSSNGFACAVESPVSDQMYSYSEYYRSHEMFNFSLNHYFNVDVKEYGIDGVSFASIKYPYLGSFYSYLDADPLPDLVQVCYEGVFAASVKNIKETDLTVWKNVEKALSRGHDIQESDYMERLWASLLSNPLEEYQIEALEEYAHGSCNFFLGALFRNTCGCVECE